MVRDLGPPKEGKTSPTPPPPIFGPAEKTKQTRKMSQDAFYFLAVAVVVAVAVVGRACRDGGTGASSDPNLLRRGIALSPVQTR